MPLGGSNDGPPLDSDDDWDEVESKFNGDDRIRDVEDANVVLDRLNNMSVEELLQQSQKLLLVELLAKVQLGQASHQELAILRNLLRDNGLVMPPRTPEQQEADRQRAPADLPVYEDPEYDE